MGLTFCGEQIEVAVAGKSPILTNIQEIFNRTHWTDPETWVSALATYLGVRW